MKRLDPLVLGTALLCVLAYGGCSVVNDVSEVDPGLTNKDGVNCGAGESFCDGACIDVSSDATNCGACGVTCGDGVACASGGCDLSCEAGQVACGNGCVDPATDPMNCGGCGNVCMAGTNEAGTCSAGVCGVTCAAGFGDCNEDPTDGCEADLMTSARHCGACDASCLSPSNAEAACIAGMCGFDGTCSTGFGDCDGNAGNGCEVRLPGDQDHCGACGNPCNANQYCRGNTCAPAVVVAADGKRRMTGNLYTIDLTTGALTVLSALSDPYAALGFVDGELYGATYLGQINHIDLPAGTETPVANTGRGPFGLGALGNGQIGICRRFPDRAFQLVDAASGDVTILSNVCPVSRSSLLGDRTSMWSVDMTQVNRYDAFGGAEMVVAHNLNDPIRGATWHLGTIYALRCNGSCNSPAEPDLITIDPTTGASTTVVSPLLGGDNLHAIASPRPVN